MQFIRTTCQKVFALPFRQIVRLNHCQITTTQLEKMRVKLVPALQDNYMYLLIDEATNKCAAVDPVEPKKLLEAVTAEKVELTCVLTTHHHWDHAGGNEELIGKTGKLPVYGGDERIGALTNKVVEDEFTLGSLNIKCMFTPCHTTGHICYYITGDTDEPAVFTGDTLFSAGCGRFFEGTPEQMNTALMKKLYKLPDNTRVFCGHEYTVANLKYAAFVEPDNEDIKRRAKWAQNQRDNNLPTIPSTIGEEKKINPFMRVDQKCLQDRYKQTDPVQVMGALRKEKDNFKPS